MKLFVRDEQPYMMRLVGIKMKIMCLGECVFQNFVGLLAVPFASDPANLVQDTKPLKIGKDQVLRSFAVQF